MEELEALSTSLLGEFAFKRDSRMVAASISTPDRPHVSIHTCGC